MKHEPCDTEFLLAQWASWARSSELSLGYPHMTPFRRLLGTSSKTCLLTDEEMLRVDRAVANLCHRQPEVGEATVIYFLTGKNITRTAKQMQKGKTKTYLLVKRGISWVDATLNNTVRLKHSSVA